VNGLQSSAQAINTTPVTQKSSKYVRNYCVFNAAAGGSPPVANCAAFPAAATNWVISVGVAATAGNGIPTTLDGFTFNLSPNVGGIVPAALAQGGIDWACTSATNVTSTGRNLANNTVPAAATAMPAKYMPSECR
jgi:type IV pilus assembly protein PilA